MSERYRQLVFRPAQPEASLVQTELVDILTGLGLIGEVVSPSQPRRYYIGERFLQYLNFMGCAPALEFEPAAKSAPDWSAFTFIHLPAVSTSVRCFVDSMMAKPTCPHCNKRHAMATQAQPQTEAMMQCPKCEHQARWQDWDWREFGGCARQFISIANVYPKEALPTESLLQHLREKTNFSWRYFYIHDVLPDVTK